MNRMKTFGKYFLWVVIFYIFSEILIHVGLNTRYSAISGDINTTSPKIEVSQAESTRTNGIIEGKITNNTGNDISKNKYVKFSLYSERDTFLSTQYIRIDDLKKDETKEFKLTFKVEQVKKYKIEIVDEKEENSIDIFTIL